MVCRDLVFLLCTLVLFPGGSPAVWQWHTGLAHGVWGMSVMERVWWVGLA